MDISFLNALRLLLDSIRQPVVFVSGMEIQALNDAARQFFGNRGERLPEELLEPIRDGKLPSVRMRAYETREGAFHIHYLPVEDGSALVFGRDPDLSGTQELRQLNEAICNKFRTPLTMLFSASGLLSEKLGAFPDPKLRKYFSVIDQNAYRLLKIVSNVSDFSSFRGGCVRLNLQTQDLAGVCGAVVRAVAPIADDLGIKLAFEAGPGQIAADIDADKMERLLYNLLSNAIKYTQREGRILVQVSASQERAFIRVSDTGAGIEPKLLPYAFRRFALEGRDDAAAGLGLGLSIVRSIAELHGGSVALESRAGEGTTVTVMLPKEDRRREMLREDNLALDYADGFSHVLLEFSDVLNNEQFARLADKIR